MDVSNMDDIKQFIIYIITLNFIECSKIREIDNTLNEINQKLDKLDERMNRIENVLNTFKNPVSGIKVTDGSYNMNITKFPNKLHNMFTKRGEYYFCDCKKNVFDDIIDLNYGLIKSIHNLKEIAVMMIKSRIDLKFIVDLIYNSEFNGYKLKVIIYGENMFSFDNLNITFLKGKKVDDYYIINDNFDNYYDKIIKAFGKRNHCDIKIGNNILFFW